MIWIAPGPGRRARFSVMIPVLILLGLIGLVTCGVIVYSIQGYEKTRNLAMAQFNRQQAILARSIARQVEIFLAAIESDLDRLCQFDSVVAMTPAIGDRLAIFQMGIPKKTSVRRLDRHGALRYIVPMEGWRGGLEGRDYSRTDYFRRAREHRATVISGVVRNEVGEKRIRVARPIYEADDEGRAIFAGALVASFDVEALSLFTDSMVSGETGYPWILSHEATVLAHYERDFIGKNAFAARREKNPNIDFTRIDDIQNRMMAGEEGVDRYISGWHRQQLGLIEKYVAYTPVRAFDRVWSVAVCAPINEVEGLVRDAYRRDLFTWAVGMALLLSGAVGMFVVPYRWLLARRREIDARMQTEEALGASRRFSDSMINAMRDGLCVMTPEGVHLEVNPAFCEMTGFSRDVLVGRGRPYPYWDGMGSEPPETPETGQFEDMELIFKRRDGERFPVIVSVSRLADERGRAMSLILNVKNIEKRQRAETALRAAEMEKVRLKANIEERLRSEAAVRAAYAEMDQIFESAGDGMWVLDADFRIARVNRRFEEIFSLRRDAVIGRPCREVMGLAACGGPECPAGKVFLGEPWVSMDMEVGTDGGAEPRSHRVLSVAATPLLSHQGRVEAVIGNFKDLTYRARAQRELSAYEVRYRTVFENTGVATLVVEADLRISMANQQFEILTGHDRETIRGTHALESLFPREQWERMTRYHHARRRDPAGAPRQYEAPLICSDGHIREVCLTVALIPDTDSSIVSLLDLTPQRRAERDLARHLEALQGVMRDTIAALALTIETRDPYTAGHQRRVAELACAIAEELGLSAEGIEGIRMAGIIHDLGKIRVPAEILSKPSRLTEHELGIIRDHPRVAFDILKKIDFPWPVARMVYQHHERMDGSGYPLGLSGEAILAESRMLAVADVVEAMAFHRPYRPAIGIEKALDELARNRGKIYDERAVDACLKLFDERRFAFDERGKAPEEAKIMTLSAPRRGEQNGGA